VIVEVFVAEGADLGVFLAQTYPDVFEFALAWMGSWVRRSSIPRDIALSNPPKFFLGQFRCFGYIEVVCQILDH
jgi:hypothetical protein